MMKDHELDALLAKELMGWDWPNEGPASWQPMFNSGDAMQVLEKCGKTLCLHIDIYYTGGPDTGGNWRVQTNVPYEPHIIDEGAETLPLAICRWARTLVEALRKHKSNDDPASH